jgi:hypothetical protein
LWYFPQLATTHYSLDNVQLLIRGSWKGSKDGGEFAGVGTVKLVFVRTEPLVQNLATIFYRTITTHSPSLIVRITIARWMKVPSEYA